MLKAIDSLALRVVILLTLALMPIGFIAVSQTKKLSDEVQARLDLSLLAATGLSAREENAFVLRASGAAEALSSVLPALNSRPEQCSAYLRTFLKNANRFSFLGFIDETGQMDCSTASGPMNFQGNTIFEAVSKNQTKAVYRSDNGRVSGRSVIVAIHPVVIDEEFKGYTAVSIPQSEFSSDFSGDVPELPLDVITFNSDGEILTSNVDIESAEKEIPVQSDLKTLVGAGAKSFRGKNQNGEERVYALVPLMADTVSALSIWDAESPFVSAASFNIAASVFPLLMWLASLGVAYLALHQMVLRHVGRIRERMAQFAKSRTLEREEVTGDMPSEFQDMQQDFETMAQTLLQDEAELEGAVREKNILLKEVHHRVKNNLQLISSIMNMHMRIAESSETQLVLRRLQDRVLGLASIHRSLYLAKDMGQLNASALLEDVINQLVVVGVAPGANIDIRKQIADLHLYPDQAVPLSLFVSEAVTNAMKYIGAPEQGQPWLSIVLERESETVAVLKISNSKDAGLSGQIKDVESTGVGSKLMRSFSTQLGAETDTFDNEDSFVIQARFAVKEFTSDPLDY